MKRFRFVLYTGVFLILSGITIHWVRDCCPSPSLSVSPHKVVHISFDDVVGVLKELKEKEGEYKSIFECDFLHDLKELHEEYGAKFSLYVYEKADDFNIAGMPKKYRNEFKTNASWLKFGFHAIEPEFDRYMKFQDFQVSFLNVCQAIYCFADTTSLTSVLRLHYYYGNDSIVTFINNSGG